MQYVIYFFIYGFIGWILDSLYRTIRFKKWTSKTSFDLPFATIYGLGALLMIFIHEYIFSPSIVIEFFTWAILLSTLEYIGGIFTLKVHGERFWDYSKNPWNLSGHTDLWHAVMYGVLGIAFTYFLHPLVLNIIFS